MDIPWLIGFFFGVHFLCGTSSAHLPVLPISKDFNGHKTQYRFQYFVRDERGDYKTQEEAGEGGNARGSYAVEEPDGDLRIVQYTADLGGGFKAHIKVDHGGKSAAKLQEIDIPAEEMRKLIEENRKKTVREVPEVDQSSKSYVLGPPRKMSDIVMEQAAAIREIISKEIEAEEKREAAERLRNEKPSEKSEGLEKTKEKALKVETASVKSEENPAVLKAEDKNLAVEKSETYSTQSSNSNSSEGRTAKVKKIEEENAGGESLRNSQVFKKITSPMVRVAIRPRNVDEVKPQDSAKQNAVPGGGSVRNFSFKNRIMFYKPAEKKAGLNQPEIASEGNFKRVPEPLENFDKNMSEDREEIVLYSPYDNEGNEDDRKSRFITVPYEVLRPYLSGMQEEEESSK